MRSDRQPNPASPLAIDLFSLFPAMFAGPFDQSIVRRARDRDLVRIAVHDPRDWTANRHRTVDDAPYGGGAGMVMMAPPIVEAVESVLGPDLNRTRLVVLSAAGRRFDQRLAESLAAAPRLALICGHYEGIDERVADLLAAVPVSIGDYVLTGGELPAMVIVDAVVRLLPGAIDAASSADESHVAGLLEHPHFTRPHDYRGLRVPDVLTSGDHGRIAAWRRAQTLARTARWRPDLLASRSAATPAEGDSSSPDPS